MRVISCESVRCSATARRRSDSFKSFGTYAPMKTPLRFAIFRFQTLSESKFDVISKIPKTSLQIKLRALQCGQVCKPNFVPASCGTGDDHSSSPFVAKWIERPTRRSSRDFFKPRVGRAALFDASLFGLALRGVYLAATCRHSRRCALTLSFVNPKPHHFTHHLRTIFHFYKCDNPQAGLFSVALVVTQQLNARKPLTLLTSISSKRFPVARPAVSWLAAL